MKSRLPLMILALTLFIDMLGFGFILPQIPVYITHFGGQPWIGGVLLASFSTMQFICSPLWGRASDKIGRRPIILISLIGSACSYFSFGAASSLTFLFVARIACGILTSASLPTAQAYIADVTPPDKRAGGMAVLGASFGLGFAFGPMIGGYLSQHPINGISSLAMPAYFAAGLALLNFCSALFFLPESRTQKDREEARDQRGMLQVFPDIYRALQNPSISAQLLVYAFSTFAFTAVESSFSWLVILRFKSLLLERATHAYEAANPGQLFANVSPVVHQHFLEKAQTGATSTIFTVVGITILFTQLIVMGGLARRVGEHHLVMFGSLLLTLALVGIGFAPSLLVINILSAFIAIGSGVMNPSLSALITHSATAQDRGMLSGAQQGMGSLARIVAPPINNYLIGIYTGIPFFVSSILMGTAFALSLRLKPLPKTDKGGKHSGGTTGSQNGHSAEAPAEAYTAEISH